MMADVYFTITVFPDCNPIIAAMLSEKRNIREERINPFVKIMKKGIEKFCFSFPISRVEANLK